MNKITERATRRPGAEAAEEAAGRSADCVTARRPTARCRHLHRRIKCVQHVVELTCVTFVSPSCVRSSHCRRIHKGEETMQLPSRLPPVSSAAAFEPTIPTEYSVNTPASTLLPTTSLCGIHRQTSCYRRLQCTVSPHQHHNTRGPRPHRPNAVLWVDMTGR
jgi:hypothetical protein